MVRPIPEKEWNEITRSLSFFSNGASLKEINKSLKKPLAPYTLQRRLAHLVKEGKVYTEGKAQALRYKLSPSRTNEPEESFAVKESKDSLIPLSTVSHDIQKKMGNPIQARKPVGYNRKFLDSYHPNVSSYLSPSTRRRLLDLGKTDGHRPAGTYARQIFNRLLIDLSWNSSRLEGNTYSLLETERLLNLSKVVQGKDFKEARMILNHKEAIEFLVDSAPHIGINRYTILNLHALLSNDLLGNLESCGRLRSIAVGIGKSVYQPLVMPQLIEECFQQILDTAKDIQDPLEQAFFLMVHLPYLQPFEDVNKRVSRLAANIPLIQHNLCPLSFIDVPQQTYIDGLLGVYELNRIELLRDVFVWAYERSCQRYSINKQELGDPDPLRLSYRGLITEIIGSIARKCMDKTAAVLFIREQVRQFVPFETQARMMEVIEEDLMSLHEGNIARYRLLPSEYEKWKESWL